MIIDSPIITGSLTLSGSLNVTGSTTFTGSVDISGSSTLTGSLGATGSIVFSGSLDVTGSTVLSGSLNVTGSTTLTGSLDITGSSTLTGSLGATGSIVFSGSLELTGSTIFSGSLNVTGSTTFTGSVDITGSSTLTGSLGATGSIVFSGSLDVTGSTLITGSLELTGSTILSGSLNVTGSTIFTGSVDITGSSTLTGSLNISGSLTTTDTITAQTLVVQTITSSIVYSSGSNIFGNDLTNTQVFTGSLSVTGSQVITGSLDVNYSQNATSNFYFRNTDNTNASSRTYLNLIAGNASAGIAVLAGGSDTGSLYIGGVAGGSIYFQPNLGGTVSMTITGSNIGIGTTTPSQKLEVVGGEIKAGRVDSSNEGGQLSFGRASDNNTGFYIDLYGSTSTPDLRFVDVSNGAVRMTIAGDGMVTTPGQPFAMGGLDGNQSIPALTFTALNFSTSVGGFYFANVGNCWNNSTRTFTAPVTGVYMVNVSLLTDSVGQVAFHVGGVRKHSIPAPPFSSSITWGGTAMIPLTAGEGLTLQGYGVAGSVTQNQYHTFFSIYLLG